jgi:hypothetical protein
MLAALLQTPFKTELTSKERSIRTFYCPYPGAARPLKDQNDTIIELVEDKVHE